MIWRSIFKYSLDLLDNVFDCCFHIIIYCTVSNSRKGMVYVLVLEGNFWMEKCTFIDSVFEKLMNIKCNGQRNLNAIVI